MTARRVAEWALDQAQTQALIGNNQAMLRALLKALVLIKTHGNSIPEETRWPTTNC
jgi:hypothetical protein